MESRSPDPSTYVNRQKRLARRAGIVDAEVLVIAAMSVSPLVLSGLKRNINCAYLPMARRYGVCGLKVIVVTPASNLMLVRPGSSLVNMTDRLWEVILWMLYTKLSTSADATHCLLTYTGTPVSLRSHFLSLQSSPPDQTICSFSSERSKAVIHGSKSWAWNMSISGSSEDERGSMMCARDPEESEVMIDDEV